MNRVLVTGVTGKSGNCFLKEIISHSEDLTDFYFKFFIRDSSRTDDLHEALKTVSSEIFIGDLNNEENITRFMQGGYDTLIHISGIHRSIPLVKAALAAGVSRLILVHTTGIYSKYKNAGEEYRRIDAEVERMCQAENASLTILRPTMIYGDLKDNNISVFISMVDKLRLFPVIGGAKYELQPVWCGDLGKAYYSVLINPVSTENKNYNLSGGKPIMLIDMLKVIGNQLGVNNTFISVPYPVAYFGACALYILSLKKKDYREKVQRLVEARVYSHDEATRDFGYQPLDFEIGIKSEIEMYIKHRQKN